MPPLTPLTDIQIPIPLKSGKLTLTLKNNPNPNPPPIIVCARCHSLRHYGCIKNPSAEPLIPFFDFERTVAPRILSPSGPCSLFLLIYDASDFHDSFPRSLSRLLHTSFLKNADNWKHNEPANLPRPILVLTKLDVLSNDTDVTSESLFGWAHELVAAPLAGVHLVSAIKNWGVKELVEHVAELARSRGDVWAVGSQNAEKSTLINAMGRYVAGKEGKLTEALVPGTTLGIVKVDGVLGGQAKLFDTPGILHPYQIMMRLNREEQRIVHVEKELRPRTYRIKVNETVVVHCGFYSQHGGYKRTKVTCRLVEILYLLAHLVAGMISTNWPG